MLKRVLFLLLCSSTIASADVLISHTERGYKVIKTLPNGVKESVDASRTSYSLGSATVSLNDAIPQVNIEVQDDVGATIWSGPVKNGMHYLLFPGADGKFNLIYAGKRSGENDGKAIFFINLTGQDVAFDFLGQAGIDAKRGLKLPANQFDTKNPFRFHPKECMYNLTFVDAQGQTQTIEGTNNMGGKYCAIFKCPHGGYRIGEVGFIK